MATNLYKIREFKKGMCVGRVVDLSYEHGTWYATRACTSTSVRAMHACVHIAASRHLLCRKGLTLSAGMRGRLGKGQALFSSSFMRAPATQRMGPNGKEKKLSARGATVIEDGGINQRPPGPLRRYCSVLGQRHVL